MCSNPDNDIHVLTQEQEEGGCAFKAGHYGSHTDIAFIANYTCSA
jgi:hypothetical protein